MNHLNPIDEASDPETPFQRLLQLSLSDDVEVRRALVDNPSIAVDESGVMTNQILLKLAKEFPDEVAACSSFALFGIELKEIDMLGVAKVVARKANGPNTLTLIFYEFGPSDVDVRIGIAKNPKAPCDVLKFLTNECDAHIRECVAMNSNAPPDALRLLADKTNEQDPYIRRVAVKNPNMPLDVLRFLADSKNEPDSAIRLGVTLNPNTPPNALRFLANKNNEPEEYVRSSATQTLKKRGLL